MAMGILQIIVYVAAALGFWQFLRPICLIIFQTFKQLLPTHDFVTKYGLDQEGSWVVVTGGTDGIGLGFCEYLADFGCNICIVSRNQQKIKRVIHNLKERTSQVKFKQGKVQKFKSLVANFTNCSDAAFFDDIKRELEGLRIGLLVNNVGTSDINNFDEFSLSLIINIINVNCTSMAGMTSILFPQIKPVSVSTKSAIINLSSFLGQFPAPYVTVYSATKAFNDFFSSALTLEKCTKGIDILLVKPLFVESTLSKAVKGFTVPDRRQCARACIRELRWQNQTAGYYVHRLMTEVVRCLPKELHRLGAKTEGYKRMIKYRNQ